MEVLASIGYKLCMAVRLYDTTDASVVTVPMTEFYIFGKKVQPRVNDDGYYVFLGQYGTQFSLEVRAPGYLPLTAAIDLEKKEQGLPIKELFLVPGYRYPYNLACFELSGNLPGISHIEGVRLDDGRCNIKDFDARFRVMTVMSYGEPQLTKVFYGILDPGSRTYEAVKIAKQISDTEFKLEKPLKKEFKDNFTVCRRIFGQADPQGNYVLKVRSDRKNAVWVIRYIIGEEEVFKTVDFNRPETIELP